MAAFDHVRNMYDAAVKPRILHSLVKEHVPDEKNPFRSPSGLSYVVSMIKTHGLLSESFVEPTEPKLVEKTKSAVDSWVDRLLLLVSSNMPDKCWAGISLLGVTCQECSSDRFLVSYSVWFHKLLLHIQLPAGSHFVKLASCTSMSDLLTRLGGFLNLKKDGMSHAGKLVQPVLKLLNEDSSEAVWEGATHLLCSIITFFPSSVQRHYETVEAAIVSKIRSGRCSESTMKKLVHCLAILPKSRGDEDSWSLMMQKILYSINIQLNDAFEGLEEETKRNEVIRLLVPPGKDPPPPLGGHTTAENLNNTTSKSDRLVISNVSTMMSCCCTMLTNYYPVQVTVPVRPLLALVARVLMVDGSLSHAPFPFTTAMQQQFICSQLPVLHAHSLDILIAVTKGVRSQLLPHAAEIIQLLTQYFRRCDLPELRIKVYSILRILLISMGVGIALYLGPEVIDNASLDLKSIYFENCGTPKTSLEAFSQPNHKKRKHAADAGSREEQHDNSGLELGATCRNLKTPISLKIAALEALEALLTVGCASKSETWRANIDLLLITAATYACKGGWANEESNPFLHGEHNSTWADFQLASLHALLASLLSQARVRPRYLAQSLELFRRGKQETGTRLAEFCAHALLALEVLIHPRARSLADFPSASSNSFDETDIRFSNNIYSGGQRHNILFSSGIGKGPGDADQDEDDLYRSWLENGDDIEAPVADSDKDNRTEEPSKSFTDPPLVEKLHFVNDSSTIKDLEGNKQSRALEDVNVGIQKDRDEMMVEAAQLPEPISHEGVTNSTTFGGSASQDIGPGKKVISGTGASDSMGSEMTSGKGSWIPEGDGVSMIGKEVHTTAVSNAETIRVLDLERESSEDSFPDIVDADPDSD